MPDYSGRIKSGFLLPNSYLIALYALISELSLKPLSVMRKNSFIDEPRLGIIGALNNELAKSHVSIYRV